MLVFFFGRNCAVLLVRLFGSWRQLLLVVRRLGERLFGSRETLSMSQSWPAVSVLLMVLWRQRRFCASWAYVTA